MNQNSNRGDGVRRNRLFDTDPQVRPRFRRSNSLAANHLHQRRSGMLRTDVFSVGRGQ
jgi:hypothetical protein